MKRDGENRVAEATVGLITPVVCPTTSRLRAHPDEGVEAA